MSPIGLTVSCKSLPPIEACIDPGSPIWACIDLGPPFEHVLTKVCTSASCIILQIILRHCVIKWRHSVNFFLSGKHSSRAYIWDTKRYGFCNFKIWPLETPFLTLALTMKVIRDRLSKLISWVAAQVLLSHQVWSWSIKKYSKNKVFLSIMTWPNFDLDLWPWPLMFGMMVTNTLVLTYANDDVP
jgi:hypothetical protein